MGNEAIARGALEAGVGVAASYPGTPSSEIVGTLSKIGPAIGMYVEWSTNEKVAFETAMAASLCGVRAMASMKHVGVNVALDSIMTASYIGAVGGLVLISADDPGAWSSQSEQDNRYIAQQAYLPVLEPSSVQEAKDMVVRAFDLSEQFQQPFIVRPVTRVAHGRGDVVLGPLPEKRRKGVFFKDASRFVLNPGSVRKNRPLLIQRLKRIQDAANELPFNRLRITDGSRIGIIAGGVAYTYAMDALRWLGIEDSVSVLKIGTTYPVPSKLVLRLLEKMDRVLVIEELEPILELHVKSLAFENRLTPKVHGKDLLPVAGELSVDIVAEAVSRIAERDLPSVIQEARKRRSELVPLAPVRPPTLCAGCPHRASFYDINAASRLVSMELGESVVPVHPGDIGCYGLGFQPPLNSKDVSISMGGSFGMANGFARVLDVPIVAHMGDSTFFHSGIPPMINLVYNRANVTMVILDNSSTSMTGFQPHPGSGVTALGEGTVKISPEAVARACGIEFVEVEDPFETSKAIDTIARAIRHHGPSFVVLRRKCAVLAQREGQKALPWRVDQNKCVDRKPPCQVGCPLHVDVQGYVAHIREGRFSEALELIHERLPFPGILGRVCTRPCEGACIRKKVDDPISIAALHRSVADHAMSNVPKIEIRDSKDQKIAVVGGGPAGITAAFDLRKLGYKVTIFEALPVLGGMLAVGVPEYRLPRDILKSELAIIEEMGVEIRLNTRIGADLSFSELRSSYNAIFLATGAHRSVGLFGDEVEGTPVMDGLELLRNVSLGEKVPSAHKATIVGGGMAAVDCARTCIRLGFQQVEMLYRRSRSEMPVLDEEVQEAEKEGVKIHFLVSPKSILGTKPLRVECVRMSLGEVDASGRRQPSPIHDSEFCIETDLLVSAIGARPAFEFIEEREVRRSSDQRFLHVDQDTMATHIPGVFAGGDAVSGPSTVVQAMAAGRRAAASIDRFLRGLELRCDVSAERGSGNRPLMNLKSVPRAARVQMRTATSEDIFDISREVNLGYSLEEAAQEAKRCLSCECKTCINLLGCPAVILEHGRVAIDQEKCPGCGVCAQVCPNEAIVKGGRDGNSSGN